MGRHLNGLPVKAGVSPEAEDEIEAVLKVSHELPRRAVVVEESLDHSLNA